MQLRLLTATLLLTLTAPAQDFPTLKVDAHLIDTTVSVHNASGGHAEQLPLSIGLVIDTSGSQEKFIKDHERDIADFLHQTLLPDDRAFALCFGNHLRLANDWTNDQSAIINNLRSYDKGHRDGPDLGPIEERDLGTALNDAVFYSTTEKMVDVHQRRKVLVVFSDGEENSSEHDLIDAIEAAQNNDVLVYAIRYTELNHGKMNARDRYGMRELDHITAQTGGKSYDVHSMKVSQAFAEISGELRSLYGVAYQSTNKVRDGSFRKIVIQPTRPGLVLRARAGYYAR